MSKLKGTQESSMKSSNVTHKQHWGYCWATSDVLNRGHPLYFEFLIGTLLGWGSIITQWSIWFPATAVPIQRKPNKMTFLLLDSIFLFVMRPCVLLVAENSLNDGAQVFW